ncbi:hypothetical protein TSOC_015192, partial [Tetrabaena socialis]
VPAMELGRSLDVGLLQYTTSHQDVSYPSSYGTCAALGATLADVSGSAAPADGGAALAAAVRLASQSRAESLFWVAGGGAGSGSEANCTAMYGGWGPQEQPPGSIAQLPCSTSLPVLCQRDLPDPLRPTALAALGPSETLLLFSAPLTRSAASTGCLAAGGRLLSAAGPAELRAAVAALLPAAASAGPLEVWVGLSRWASSDTWSWDDPRGGSAAAVVAWGGWDWGQPNAASGDCGVLTLPGGVWRSTACSGTRAYVCRRGARARGRGGEVTGACVEGKWGS